jgi:hypothetical protein
MTDPATNIPAVPINAAIALSEVTDFASTIIQTLRVSRALLTAGRMVCLEGLDAQVAQLCARCLGLHPEDGSMLRVHLMALRAELDATSLLLTARQKAAPCPSMTS